MLPSPGTFSSLQTVILEQKLPAHLKQGHFYPTICLTVSKGRRNHMAFTTTLSSSA